MREDHYHEDHADVAAAGLIVASLGVSATADAQGRWGDRREFREDRRDFRPARRAYRADRRAYRQDRRAYRRNLRHYRQDRRAYAHRYGRGYGYGNRYAYGNRCYVTWRYNRQVRVCR